MSTPSPGPKTKATPRRRADLTSSCMSLKNAVGAKML